MLGCSWPESLLEAVEGKSETRCTDEEEGCKHDQRDAEHVDCDIERMLMV